MNKNIKRIFLLTTLLILLVGLASVNATKIDNKTSTTTKITKDTTSNIATTVKTPTKKVNKNINKNKTKKTDSANYDYYVSDNTGDDNNDGSDTRPYKTIQTALNNAKSDGNTTIHITEGTYKGVGNTNLTVNGSKNINIVGSGIDKTFIDGEAKYEILNEGGNWNSSTTWYPYKNYSGNWIMNITEGSGIVTIKNFTIQNSWTASGENNSFNPVSTVNNWGTLISQDMYFCNNHAGLGAGIRNNPTGTLFVENNTFYNNSKSTGTGNFGAAIYNNGTAYVNNILVTENYARWGTITNDRLLYLTNSTIRNNIGYDGKSSYKFGTGVYANTEKADYYTMTEIKGVLTFVDNCVFEGNDQCDINTARSNISVNNCTFNNSCGIYIPYVDNGANFEHNYTNNKFFNMTESTIELTQTNFQTPTFAIYSLGYCTVNAINNTISVPIRENSYALFLTGNAVVKNNTMDNIIYVDYAYNTIVNNTINTTTDYTILFTNKARYCSVEGNTLIAKSLDGDFSLFNPHSTTKLSGNVPSRDQINVTAENYTVYFDDQSIARNDVIQNRSKIVLIGDFHDKDFIFDNMEVYVEGNNVNLYNATIITQNNAIVTFDGLNIVNTENSAGYVVLFNSRSNLLKNSDITVNSSNALHAIQIEEDFNRINNVTLNMTAPSYDVDWTDKGTARTVGLFIASSDNLVENSRVYLDATQIGEGSSYPSADAIDIQSKNVGEYITGNTIRKVNVNVNGATYAYGLNIARAKNTCVNLSNIDVTSTFYGYAIQIGDSQDNIISSNITVKAEDTGYGVYITGMNTGVTNNTTFVKLNIQDINALNAIGAGFDAPSNILITDSSFNLTGQNAIAVKIIEDTYNGFSPENITINSLNVNILSTVNEANILDLNNIKNLLVNNSVINAKTGKEVQVNDCENVTIENNYINIGNVIGGDKAITNNTVITTSSNSPNIAILTDDSYSTFFDANSTYTSDCDIISLGGDLHNKNLKFVNLTYDLRIVNLGNYTIYNGTIIVAGNSSINKEIITVSVENINFNNMNKAVFKDEVYETSEIDVIYKDCNITVTGDDIKAFDAFNKNSYIYLNLTRNFINMTGKNVVVISYAGYNANQPVRVEDNTIIVNASNNAVVLNASQALISFNRNNITHNAKTALTVNTSYCIINFYNFEYNNITGTADSISALNFAKIDTAATYIEFNNINFTSNNPVTVINTTGQKVVFVYENNITVNAYNKNIPVVYVTNPNSQVINNYIKALDVTGNDAVANTGITIVDNIPVTNKTNNNTNNNTQNGTNNNTNNTQPKPPAKVNTKITVNSLTSTVGSKVTIKATVVDSKSAKVNTGKVIFTVNNVKIGEANVKNGVSSLSYVVPESWLKSKLSVKANYVASGNYLSSSYSSTGIFKISKGKVKVTLNKKSLKAKRGQTITLKANVVDVNNKKVNNGKIVLKINGKTVKGKYVKANVKKGVATVKYTIPDSYVAKKYNVKVEYSSTYYKTTVAKATLTVQKSPVKIKSAKVTYKKKKITVKATLKDYKSKALTKNTKVTIKINGKTVKKNIVCKKGKLSTSFTKKLKKGSYKVQIISASNSYYNAAKITKKLKVKA